MTISFIDFLLKNQQKLLLVESCTGGRLASYFTNLNNSFDWFLGSLVVYQKQIKSNLLGLNISQSLYTEKFAYEMANHAFKYNPKGITISISGNIAGDNIEKGIAYVAISFNDIHSVSTHKLVSIKLKREEIKDDFVKQIVILLEHELIKHKLKSNL